MKNKYIIFILFFIVLLPINVLASNITFIAIFEKITNPNTDITTPLLVPTVLLILSIGFIKLTDKKKIYIIVKFN